MTRPKMTPEVRRGLKAIVDLMRSDEGSGRGAFDEDNGAEPGEKAAVSKALRFIRASLRDA